MSIGFPQSQHVAFSGWRVSSFLQRVTVFLQRQSLFLCMGFFLFGWGCFHLTLLYLTLYNGYRKEVRDDRNNRLSRRNLVSNTQNERAFQEIPTRKEHR